MGAVGVALLAMLPASASTGPFYGQVKQDQTSVHWYDNNPAGDPCVDVMVWYAVTMTYTPASDTLGLSAAGQTAVGADGRAVVSFMASACTAFAIKVSGLRVATLASYRVTVTSSTGGTVA